MESRASNYISFFSDHNGLFEDRLSVWVQNYKKGGRAEGFVIFHQEAGLLAIGHSRCRTGCKAGFPIRDFAVDIHHETLRTLDHHFEPHSRPFHFFQGNGLGVTALAGRYGQAGQYPFPNKVLMQGGLYPGMLLKRTASFQ